jgi:hypothetical protein
MELGTVISTFDSPTTNAFSFVISNNSVRKGQFVQTKTEDGLLIGMVVEVTRANRYFERPESVAEYEKEAPISSSFPTEEWEYIVANVRPFGIFEKNALMRNTFPAAPGQKVFSADDETLGKFLGFADNGMNVGSIPNHNVEAKVGMNKLFQKHLAVLALSGAGKSYTTSVILEELLDRKKEDGRVATVVIDPHGEYASFKNGEYANRTTVIKGEDIRIAFMGVSPYTLAEWMPNATAPQRREMVRVICDMKKEADEKRTFPNLNDLIDKIESSSISENIRLPLLAWISEIRRLGIIGRRDNPKIEEIALPGRLTVLDISDIDDLRKKQIIVSYFARKLFSLRKKGEIPPFVLFVEEAHNFVPESVKMESCLSKGIIEKIAREGRKFGASMCLISQRPVRLSTTALSQCNTTIIMRVTNPYDVDHIGRSCEAMDKGMLQSITTLRVGEALIIGEAVNHPVFFKVRRRRSQESLKGRSMEDMAKEFEGRDEKKVLKVEAFL